MWDAVALKATRRNRKGAEVDIVLGNVPLSEHVKLGVAGTPQDSNARLLSAQRRGPSCASVRRSVMAQSRDNHLYVQSVRRNVKISRRRCSLIQMRGL